MDCDAEINRIFVGSTYLFVFFSLILISFSNGYTRMEKHLNDKILELDKKICAYKTGEPLSSCEDDTLSELDSTDCDYEVIVFVCWEYSNTI